MTQPKEYRLRMTASAYGVEYSAEVGADATLDRVMGAVVVPLLLSLGYQRGSIEKMFVDGMPTEWDDIYDLDIDFEGDC